MYQFLFKHVHRTCSYFFFEMEELEKLGQQINKGEKEIDKTIADKYAKIDGLLVLTEKNVLKNEDLISGFCYVLENNFDKLWENSGKEEKEKLKQILLKTSENVELNDENSMKIANLTIKIFKELEYNWQELIDYILSPIPSSHKGLLFLKVLSAWEDFVEKPRLEAIFRSIRQFISFDDPKLQLSIIITVNNMNPIPLLQQEPSFFEALWAAILNISKNLPSRISTCATVCAELYKAAPVLRDFESSYLSSIVEKSKTFEEMQLILPFSHILNELDLTNLYANVVEYIDSILENNEQIMKFINFMTSLQLELILDDSLETIHTFLINCLPGDVGLVLFVPFAPFVSEYYEKDEFTALLLLMLKSDNELHIALGIKTLINIAINADFFSLELKSSVLKSLINLIPNPDVFTVVEKLIRSGLFDHEKALAALANLYSKQDNSIKDKIFDLFRLFLRTTAPKDLSVDIVFDFAYITLRSSNNLHEIGQCISVLNGTFLQKCQAFIVCTEDYIPFDLKLIEQNIHADYAIENLSYCLKVDPETFRPICKEKLDSFIEFSKTSYNSIPSVVFICLILKDNEKLGYSLSLLRLIPDDFPQTQEVLLKVSHILKGCDVSFGNDLCDLLVKRALTTSDTKDLNDLLDCIIKLLKRMEIQKSIIDPLFESLSSLSHPVFNKKGWATFSDNTTRIAAFFTACERRYPELKERVSKLICKWFNLSPFSMMSVFTDAVTELALDESLCGEAQKLYDILFSNLSEDETVTDARILRALVILIKSDESICDIDLLVAHLINLWENTKQLKGYWRSSLGTAILELCALGAEASIDDLEDVLTDFPFQEGFCVCDAACRALCEMMDSPEYEDLEAATAKSISDVLLLSSAKIIRLGICNETLVIMKKLLFTILGKYDVLIPELKKIYVEQSERDLEKFCELTEEYNKTKQ